jgi:cyclophilin family peptidyl-prolyl cis-trans isomerase
MGSLTGPVPSATGYHIYVYGKHLDPLFQKYKTAAESLAKERPEIQATVQGFFETQYEQQLKYIISTYGGSFSQATPDAPIIFAETDDAMLYFADETRFFDWAFKRFDYEDHTGWTEYNAMGTKMYKEVQESMGRSYCALALTVGEAREVVQLELFDEECPNLCRNFLTLLAKDEFNGHLVHRVKAGAWIQAGDLVDGSGAHSLGADGELHRHESFAFLHDKPGLLGMCNHGKDTNGSQFYITLRELPFLDGTSVVFGRVINGMQTLLKVGSVKTRNERPVEEVKVYAEAEQTLQGALQKK